MTIETKNELLEVHQRMEDLSKQFLKMIDHILEVEQGLHNVNGKINIHIKEGHKPNEQGGTGI
jgi:hypothetical protein|tara:strand:- start:1856 stop:2044 length:189 start_codon:yes stop_codon:yes gene_type:complete